MKRAVKIVRGIPVVLDVLKGQSEDQIRTIFGNPEHFDEEFIKAILIEAEKLNGKTEKAVKPSKKSETKKGGE